MQATRQIWSDQIGQANFDMQESCQIWSDQIGQANFDMQESCQIWSGQSRHSSCMAGALARFLHRHSSCMAGALARFLHRHSSCMAGGQTSSTCKKNTKFGQTKPGMALACWPLCIFGMLIACSFLGTKPDWQHALLWPRTLGHARRSTHWWVEHPFPVANRCRFRTART
jgi:hypothetical protein